MFLQVEGRNANSLKLAALYANSEAPNDAH
jgi:hypothetical protein